MKKLLPYANYIAAGAGVLGGLLRQWMLVAGTENKGLYPAAHSGWIGYLLTMAVAVAAIYLITRRCDESSAGSAIFSSGFFSALGHAAAACALALYGLPLLSAGKMLPGLLALCGAVALASVPVSQFCQKAPLPMIYLPPCLFFALQLFLLGRQYSAETQLLLFLPQVFAAAASTLAAYQLMGIGAGLGNQRKSLFWSLSAACLCFAAAPGAHWMYGAIGLWHLLGHCSLTEPKSVTEEAPTEQGEE